MSHHAERWWPRAVRQYAPAAAMPRRARTNATWHAGFERAVEEHAAHVGELIVREREQPERRRVGDEDAVPAESLIDATVGAADQRRVGRDHVEQRPEAEFLPDEP